MIMCFQVLLILLWDGKANNVQCSNGKRETELSLFSSVAKMFYCSLTASWLLCSLLWHAALQLNKWDPVRHTSTPLENVHLPPPSDLKALMLLGASHLISLISLRTFWCSLRLPWGDCRAVWSPAKQKFMASVTDPVLTWEERLRGEKGLKRDSKRWGFGGKIWIERERKNRKSDFQSGLASFCWSCGTRWLEQQTAWRAVATQSQLLRWLNCSERVAETERKKDRKGRRDRTALLVFSRHFVRV